MRGLHDTTQKTAHPTTATAEAMKRMKVLRVIGVIEVALTAQDSLPYM